MLLYNPDERGVVKEGTYKGYEFKIVSLGTHPCAYVRIPQDHKYHGVCYSDLEFITCHGGLTYSENYIQINSSETVDGWWVGWDYAHHGDYTTLDDFGFYDLGCDDEDQKKWTEEEIMQDIESVIEQLQAEKQRLKLCTHQRLKMPSRCMMKTRRLARLK